MSETVPLATESRLGDLEARLRRLEALLPHLGTNSVPPAADAPRETPVPPWVHLVARRHPWRRQLYLKGRNLTARQLVGSLRANGHTEEEAARNHSLPVAAVLEAVAYVDANGPLIEFECALERYLVAEGGTARGPQPVSR